MIYVYVGKPGKGKTLALLREAVQALNKGLDVWSNFYINLPKLINLGFVKKEHGHLLRWSKVQDLIPIKNGVILMDECQIYFNSRKWQVLPEELQYKFQQHRKHHVDIIGAVQKFSRIDVVVRELVNVVYGMRKYFNFIFTISQYDPDDVGKSKLRRQGFKFFFLNKKFADCYDTYQEIDSSKI